MSNSITEGGLEPFMFAAETSFGKGLIDKILNTEVVYVHTAQVEVKHSKNIEDSQTTLNIFILQPYAATEYKLKVF